jgi:hypothetical protein
MSLDCLEPIKTAYFLGERKGIVVRVLVEFTFYFYKPLFLMLC